MKTIIKIVLGIVIATVLLVGGCAALVGGALNSATKDGAEHAISQAEFKALKQGDSLSDVLDRLGEPKDRQTMQNQGIGKTVYLYYNVEGGDLGDQYQITFTNGVLDGKNAY